MAGEMVVSGVEGVVSDGIFSSEASSFGLQATLKANKKTITAFFEHNCIHTPWIMGHNAQILRFVPSKFRYSFKSMQVYF